MCCSSWGAKRVFSVRYVLSAKYVCKVRVFGTLLFISNLDARMKSLLSRDLRRGCRSTLTMPPQRRSASKRQKWVSSCRLHRCVYITVLAGVDFPWHCSRSEDDNFRIRCVKSSLVQPPNETASSFLGSRYLNQFRLLLAKIISLAYSVKYVIPPTHRKDTFPFGDRRGSDCPACRIVYCNR